MLSGFTIFFIKRRLSKNYLLPHIDLSTIVKVTISSPTLLQGVTGFVSSFLVIFKSKLHSTSWQSQPTVRVHRQQPRDCPDQIQLNGMALDASQET